MSKMKILTVSPEQGQLLLDVLSRANANEINFQVNDFSFADIAAIPEMVQGQNTRITLVPKENTGFYGTKTIYYRRMDFSFLNTGRVAIHPGTATKLSDLIPEINEKFGTLIESSDYYDDSIQTDTSTGKTFVKIKAKPDSLLFTGEYILTLGGVDTSLVDTDDVERRIFIFTGNNPDIYKSVVCVDSDGTTVKRFGFLSNVSGVGYFRPTKMFLIKEPHLVLTGDFTLTYKKNEENITVNTRVLYIDSYTGEVTGHSDEDRFGTDYNLEYVTHRRYQGVSTPYQYVIDRNNRLGKNRSGIYRFNHLGELDTGFNVKGIAYRPDSISVSVDGSVYTATPRYNVDSSPTSKVCIDRLLPNGNLDTEFTRVQMTSRNTSETLMVSTMYPVIEDGEDKGIWMLLNPVYGVSSLTSNQLIHGENIVPSGESRNYSWIPIIRIGRDGSWVKNFNNLLLNNNDTSVYSTIMSNMVRDKDSVVGDNYNVCFFTNKPNPITGFTHRTPIEFTDTGKMKLINGSDYAVQYYWVDANHLIRQSNGLVISYGHVLPVRSEGGWGNVTNIVARMHPDGRNNKVLFRLTKEEVATNVEIRNVVLIERSV